MMFFVLSKKTRNLCRPQHKIHVLCDVLTKQWDKLLALFTYI